MSLMDAKYPCWAAVHTVVPVLPWYLPSSQSVQEVCPTLAVYLPAGHAQRRRLPARPIVAFQSRPTPLAGRALSGIARVGASSHLGLSCGCRGRCRVADGREVPLLGRRAHRRAGASLVLAFLASLYRKPARRSPCTCLQDTHTCQRSHAHAVRRALVGESLLHPVAITTDGRIAGPPYRPVLLVPLSALCRRVLP